MILDNKVTLGATDEHLQHIPWIEVKRADGSIVEYTAPEYEPAKNGELRKRTMDCMDCHNRPTHGFQPPDSAIDKAMYSNLIARDLPWIKRTAMEALIGTYPDAETARAEILRKLTDFYKQRYPQVAEQRAADIRKAADVAGGIWERNVFPKMNVDWKTYPDNIGHRNWPGCFRCHDGRHKTKEGKVLTMECSTCHTKPERGPLGGLGDVPTSSEPDWHPWDLAAKHLAIEAHKNVLCSACHQAGLLPPPRVQGLPQVASQEGLLCPPAERVSWLGHAQTPLALPGGRHDQLDFLYRASSPRDDTSRTPFVLRPGVVVAA